MRFQENTPGACALCGDTAKLTGEHKIKASVLESEVGTDPLYIGTLGETGKPMRLAQSLNSKHLKFRSRLCESRNTARTQPADRAFDELHQAARSILTTGGEPATVFELERFAEGGEQYFPAFRYFAKLLCCHLAEADAPRHVALARFALAENNLNRVWLKVQRDATFAAFQEQLGIDRYAAHGGLVIYGDRKSSCPMGFHSMLTMGPVQYVFWTRLNWLERLDIRLRHPAFHQRCVDQVREASVNPVTEHQRRQLGM